MGRRYHIYKDRFGLGIPCSSDRGCQYSSNGYQDMLKEKIYRKKYDTIEEVKKDVFWYIEVFYNRKRRHSTLEYMTPVEYLRKYDKNRIA